jgi:hypothetical protein
MTPVPISTIIDYVPVGYPRLASADDQARPPGSRESGEMPGLSLARGLMAKRLAAAGGRTGPAAAANPVHWPGNGPGVTRAFSRGSEGRTLTGLPPELMIRSVAARKTEPPRDYLANQ